MGNIVLFGKPGAGKGTQANFLKKKYSLIHISTGDLFRYNIKNKTELGKLAKSFMDKGDLVPDKVTIKMLEEEVKHFYSILKGLCNLNDLDMNLLDNIKNLSVILVFGSLSFSLH